MDLGMRAERQAGVLEQAMCWELQTVRKLDDDTHTLKATQTAQAAT